MDISIKFLLQSVKVLNEKKYSNEDLYLIYDFLISSTKNELFNFYYLNTVLSYKNDLELFIETIKQLIKIFEDLEYYEECFHLKNKENECYEILKENSLNNF
jgi:hypothetical protein